MMQREGAEPNSADEDWDTSTTADLATRLPDVYQLQSFQMNPQPEPDPFQLSDSNMQVNHASDCDMDPNSLIQQFNCLGTTDKDVLVSQLQKFIGPNLNKDAAQFFLDMNDWNLQRAIGSYFDLSDDQALWGDNGGGASRRTSNYSMTLVDCSEMNEVNVSPNLKLSIGWKVKNNGGEPWPPGTHLRLGDHQYSFAFPEKVFLQSQFAVPPGVTCDAILEMNSPSTLGTYNTTYQLITPEGYFIGSTIYLTVNVIHDETMDLSQQFQNLSWNGGNETDAATEMTPNVEMS